jgi:hypothetical protein
MSCIVNPDGTIDCAANPIDILLFKPTMVEEPMVIEEPICPEGLFYNGNTCIPTDMGMVKDPNLVIEDSTFDVADAVLVGEYKSTMDDGIPEPPIEELKRTTIAPNTTPKMPKIDWLPLVLLIGLGVFIISKSKSE